MLNKKALLIKHYGIEDFDQLDHIRQKDSEARRRESHGPPEQYAKLQLPYYSPDDSLPPIPTAEEIEIASRLECNEEQYNRSHTPSVLYRVNSVYAVKISQSNRLLQEVENMLFLQQHNFRVAKVYAAFSHQGTYMNKWATRQQNRTQLPSLNFLVMQYLDGIPLDERTWDDEVDPEVKIKIYGKLAEQMRSLRSIPPPTPSYYGRVHYQSYCAIADYLAYRGKVFAGPFDTYEEFVRHLWEGYEARMPIKSTSKPIDREAINPRVSLLASSFFEVFHKDAKSGEPRLTHCDLTINNVILVPPTTDENKPLNGVPVRMEDCDLYIIDWEFLAWWPAWVEMSAMMKSLPRKDNDLTSWYEVFKGTDVCHYWVARFWEECENTRVQCG